MKNYLKRFSAPVALALSLLFAQTAANASATVLYIPFEGQVYNDCAVSGDGETIYTVGSYMVVSNEVIDATGKMHVVFVFVSRDFVGTGSITGDSYRIISGSRLTVTLDPDLPNSVATAQGTLNVIGPNGLLMLLQTTFHVTLDSNGEVKGEAYNFVFKCGEPLTPDLS